MNISATNPFASGGKTHTPGLKNYSSTGFFFPPFSFHVEFLLFLVHEKLFVVGRDKLPLP